MILRPGESLVPGQAYWSKDLTCNLTLEVNGDFAMYRQCDGAEVFSFRAADMERAVFLILLNRVKLLDNSWLSSINATDGDLRMTNDCQLCLFKDGSCRWTADAVTYRCPMDALESMLSKGGQAEDKSLAVLDTAVSQTGGTVWASVTGVLIGVIVIVGMVVAIGYMVLTGKSRSVLTSIQNVGSRVRMSVNRQRNPAVGFTAFTNSSYAEP